ncbi:hypothetical protein [Nocardia sp. NPDC004722]
MSDQQQIVGTLQVAVPHIVWCGMECHGEHVARIADVDDRESAREQVADIQVATVVLELSSIGPPALITVPQGGEPVRDLNRRWIGDDNHFCQS